MANRSPATNLVHETAEQAARGALRAMKSELNGRDDNGWRAGKPLEDPEKTKRWGFVTARPSEYLVHMRKGRIRSRTSGQGATCFKWPWDSVAIIPTTIQRLFFQADQITSEKVGVQVKGLAVFRVARPELAVAMLNFSFPERAQEKLAETLRDMFVGAARRLIATLTVEDCLTRRKESLAAFLMAEIAPVVSGAGRPQDQTDRGWGVVIDTIEIQEVHVLSESVFAHMQAPYRNQLMLNARQAELAREKETLVREAMSRREIEEAKVRAESQMRELKAQMESEAARAEAEEEKRRLQLRLEAERLKLEKEAELARTRAEKEREALAVKAESEAQGRAVRAQQETAAANAEQAEALKRLALAAEAERAKVEREREAERLRLEKEAELARLHAEQERARIATGQELEALRISTQAALSRERVASERSEAEGRDALESERAARSRELRQAEAASTAELKRLELELERMQGELRAALALKQKQTENTISPEKVQSDFVNKTLPEIARSFQQRFGEVKVIAGGSENPFGFLVHAFDSVLEVAAGSRIPQVLGQLAANGVAASANGARQPGKADANGQRPEPRGNP